MNDLQKQFETEVPTELIWLVALRHPNAYETLRALYERNGDAQPFKRHADAARDLGWNYPTFVGRLNSAMERIKLDLERFGDMTLTPSELDAITLALDSHELATRRVASVLAEVFNV